MSSLLLTSRYAKTESSTLHTVQWFLKSAIADETMPVRTAAIAINVVPPKLIRFAVQIKANRSLGGYEYSGIKHQQTPQPATIQIMMSG
jgi:hypothetical protein